MAVGLVGIRVQGLGSLADITLEPGRMTVLIGPNGAGKSNILRALKLVTSLRTKSLQRVVGEEGGGSAWLHYGPKRTPISTLSVEFEQDGKRNGYDARLGHAAGDRLLFLDESVWYQPPDGEKRTTTLGGGHWESLLSEARETDVTTKAVDGWLSQITFYHFHDTSIHSELRTHSNPSDDRHLRSDGSNIAAYLARLEHAEDPDDAIAWRRINQLVHRVAPSVKQLRPTVVSNNGVRLDWIDDQDEVFGVHQMSDGTLRAVALITALAQPDKQLPKFMCIDEPELGLHPAAITLVADLARSISRHCQVLFATQSTAFLDHFDPEEVVVVEREAGKTVLHRLDAEALSGWLEDYSLSEVFDKGILGGRP
ncbi:AAA family ATPase [Nannocystaceae bacterium ST9]